MTRFFVLKAWLTGAGVAAGLAGIAARERRLVWVAVTLLAIAFLLRFGERKTDE